jgi:hypothetical protein
MPTSTQGAKLETRMLDAERGLASNAAVLPCLLRVRMWSVNEPVLVLPPVVHTSVLTWDAGANWETRDRL